MTIATVTFTSVFISLMTACYFHQNFINWYVSLCGYRRNSVLQEAPSLLLGVIHAALFRRKFNSQLFTGGADSYPIQRPQSTADRLCCMVSLVYSFSLTNSYLQQIVFDYSISHIYPVPELLTPGVFIDGILSILGLFKNVV